MRRFITVIISAFVAILLALIFSFTHAETSFAAENDDNDELSINQSELVFYRGAIIENYEYFRENPIDFGSSQSDLSVRLYIKDGDIICQGVEWTSDDDSIAEVVNGKVLPIDVGTTTIRGKYKGKTCTCTVYVKEIRFYFWHEYTGDESLNHWAWDYSCACSVGQTVPYKLVEITYGKDRKEKRRKDVTNEYPLSAEDPSYMKISAGKITALKGGTSQENGTSGLYYCIRKPGIPYVQLIRLHFFTNDRDFYNNQIRIRNTKDHRKLELESKPDVYSHCTLDGEMFTFPDWSYSRYTTKELTWKSSDTSILTIDSVKGSIPWEFSTAKYTVHKVGKVTVSALLYGKTVASLTFTTGEWMITTPTPKPTDIPIPSVPPVNLVFGTKKSSSVAAGGKLELIAPDKASTSNLKWKSSNNEIATVDKKGKVTAKMAGSVVISVTSADKTAMCQIQVLYKDVTDKSDFWYKPTNYLTNYEIVKGYDKQTLFKPANECTRAQMVTFLWRLQNCPQPNSKQRSFPDVNKDDYFYKPVLWAVEKGITTGYEDKTFKPNNVCTRAQTVTFLWRMAGKPSVGSATNPFNDVKKGDYFYNAVIWASKKKIVAGYSDGTFKPQGKCLRRQMVTFLYKYDKYFNGKG